MKKNLPLYIGLSIPVLMIILIAVSIYLPRLSTTEPKYSFLFTTNLYNAAQQFTVKDNNLMKEENPYNQNQLPHMTKLQTEPRLFFYDASKDQSQEISFEKGKMYILNSNLKSPDGFEISQSQRNYFPMLFGSRDFNAKYLQKGNYLKKINAQTDPNNIYGTFDFRFLAWTIGEINEQTGTTTATH